MKLPLVGALFLSVFACATGTWEESGLLASAKSPFHGRSTKNVHPIEASELAVEDVGAAEDEYFSRTYAIPILHSGDSDKAEAPKEDDYFTRWFGERTARSSDAAQMVKAKAKAEAAGKRVEATRKKVYSLTTALKKAFAKGNQAAVTKIRQALKI